MARESKDALGKPTTLLSVAWKEKFPQICFPDAGLGGVEKSGDGLVAGVGSSALTRVDRWSSRHRYRVLRRDAIERDLGSRKNSDMVDDIVLLDTLVGSC